MKYDLYVEARDKNGKRNYALGRCFVPNYFLNWRGMPLRGHGGTTTIGLAGLSQIAGESIQITLISWRVQYLRGSREVALLKDYF